MLTDDEELFQGTAQEAEDEKEKYAIPSAFAAYAKYMNILLGNEKKA